MRITVNNTSMMQPMFESQHHIEDNTAPMHRACGLLEPADSEDSSEPAYDIQQPVFYPQSNTNNAPQSDISWDDVQAITAGNLRKRFVVFGYLYDGDEWLRVWIKTQQRFLWITRPSNMTYRSYAAVTMKALSKIPPSWDGILHPSPFQFERCFPNRIKKTGLISTTATTLENIQAIVTDAAANEHGDLWFSVVLTPASFTSADHTQRSNANRGWIKASPEF